MEAYQVLVARERHGLHWYVQLGIDLLLQLGHRGTILHLDPLQAIPAPVSLCVGRQMYMLSNKPSNEHVNITWTGAAIS